MIKSILKIIDKKYDHFINDNEEVGYTNPTMISYKLNTKNATPKTPIKIGNH